jgi:MFS family permease
MNVENEHADDHRRENEHALSLDDVITTQPELGPSIPDGGFGWVVFIGTLFFQALVPCLIVNFGIFLAFSKLNGTAEDKNIFLWDDKFLYVPLFFSFSKCFFESFSRTIVFKATTPRLVAVVGTCLTCAGMLFMWMGMTGNHDYWLFPLAGVLSGVGASILLVQCETLVSQYFRLKLPVLNEISQVISYLGFLIAPIILGDHILSKSLTQVLLWYQAIVLQGLVVSLLFRKPMYLKSSKRTKPYQFVISNPDDEEDILSKNSRELQIKRQTSTETHVSKIQIHHPQPGPSGNTESKEQGEDVKKDPKKWESFDDDEEDVKYAKLNEWEAFDEDDDENQNTPKRSGWERFDNDDPPSPRIINNLSLADETKTQKPSPLFTDFPVNNNNTYSYDDEIVTEPTNSNVFMPNNPESDGFKKRLDLLKEPTFYKSWLMMVANIYSTFVFYSMFPSYLYIEVDSINIRHMSALVGALSLINLIFLCLVYWFRIGKKQRPICLWIFYWLGAVGYLMVADSTNEYTLLLGAVQICLSIGGLDHISKPLHGISAKGGTSNENLLLTILSSLALLLFLCIDATFKSCFRIMFILHFFVGTLWLANFAYKKLRLRH